MITTMLRNSDDEIDEFPKRQIKQKKNKKLEANRTDIARKFGKTIMLESILAICVLLVTSLLTITSPSPMNMSSMSMGSSSSSSSSPAPSSTEQMDGMSMNNAENELICQGSKNIKCKYKNRNKPISVRF